MVCGHNAAQAQKKSNQTRNEERKRRDQQQRKPLGSVLGASSTVTGVSAGLEK
jgi:hypothetical protein